MANSRRRLRPGSIGIFSMMVLNAVLGLAMLRILFSLFGISSIMPELAAHHAWAADAAKWEMFGTLIPGAAICFGLLWFWLILTGRTPAGLSWGGAAIYGLIIALLDVPVSGLLTGMLHGYPGFGLLIGLVVMILVPAIGLCMAVFGIAMGLINGWFAQRWIERKYVGEGRR